MAKENTEIIIHHSDSKDDGAVSWGEIRKWHLERGWADIGYHAGVELINDHYEALIGRPWTTVGAHCKGHNLQSLGLCVVGDWTTVEPPLDQLLKAAEVVRMWMRTYGIPITKVYRHKDFNDTDCPGAMFPWDKFKSMLMGA